MKSIVLTFFFFFALDVGADIYIDTGLTINNSGELTLTGKQNDWVETQKNPRVLEYRRGKTIESVVTVHANSRNQMTSLLYKYKSVRDDKSEESKFAIYDFLNGTVTKCEFEKNKKTRFNGDNCFTYSVNNCDELNQVLAHPPELPNIDPRIREIEIQKRARVAWLNKIKDDTQLQTRHKKALDRLEDYAKGFAFFEHKENILGRSYANASESKMFYSLQDPCKNSMTAFKALFNPLSLQQMTNNRSGSK